MAHTCEDCKYYDMDTTVDVHGVPHHPCKRNAPSIKYDAFNQIGEWPVVPAQTPVCGEFKKKKKP